MVRVNHPPGGEETRLQKNPAREPKTVRILKPPGGGSSILFDEPDGFHYPKNANIAPKSGSDSSKCSSTDSSGSSSPIPPENVNKNGNDNIESKAPASPPPAKESEKPVSSDPFPDISKVKISDTNGNDSSPKIENGENKKVESPAVSKSPEASKSPENHTTPVTNGSQPRKVKDHMKSRIFAEEEPAPEYSLYKKSSPEVVKPDQPTPQRQRPPPGGFSTKLW